MRARWSIQPSFYFSHNGRAIAFAMLGRYPDALQEAALLEKGLSDAGVPVTLARWLSAFLKSRLGQYREAERIVAQGIGDARTVKNTNAVLQFDLLSALLAMERRDFGRAVALSSQMAPTIAEIQNPGNRRVWTTTWHWIGGVSEARSGRIPQARARLDELTKVYSDALPLERSLRRSLEGEIALAAGDLPAAESAFAAAEPEIKPEFNLNNVALTFFQNGFAAVDGSARVKAARGDLAGALARLSQLSHP